jgi:tetratricopeptide (TPR) repeat protein
LKHSPSACHRPGCAAAGLAVAALLVAPGLGAAPPSWIEVKSSHFTVITNAGEGAGRRTAWQFEQIRSGLSLLWPWAKIGAGRPFLVFAAKDERTLKTLGPQYWEGKRFRPVSFWASGRDRLFVALRTDAREPDDVGANPYQTAYWSYANAVFTNAFPRRLPLWYSRGVAEVMSNTFVREKELHVGRLMQGNLDLMRQRAPIPLADFLSADRRSPWVTQESRIELFDAQAWALVHYLIFGEDRKNAPRVDRFNRLLHDGVDEQAALKEAFGDLTPYYQGMRDYVTRRTFAFTRIPVSREARQEGYAARPLPPGEAAVLCGEVLVAQGRPVEARAFAAEAAQADPALSGPWEIEAALRDAEDLRDEAKAAYTKAVEAGSKKAYVHYRLAQLEWEPGADRTRWERLATRLEAARALDPDAANTLSFLAEIRNSLGQHEEALGLATRAVELDPSRTYHRMALAHVLWNLRRPQDAVRMAESALRTADGDADRKEVEQFLELARRPQP